MPLKLPMAPRLMRLTIWASMPGLWSLNHQAEPCWILPGMGLSVWKPPMMVPMMPLSAGFRE